MLKNFQENIQGFVTSTEKIWNAENYRHRKKFRTSEN